MRRNKGEGVVAWSSGSSEEEERGKLETIR